MCRLCHDEAILANSPELIAAEHGDNNPECMRTETGTGRVQCVDCSEIFETMPEEHCCYD